METKQENLVEKILGGLKTWARINSPWAIHYNSGSCNGCDIEILVTLTPRYDLERFGIKLQGSPRHADVLICTGPVSLQSRIVCCASITDAGAEIRGGGWFLRHFQRRVHRLLQYCWWVGRGPSRGCLYPRLPSPPGSDHLRRGAAVEQP